MKRIVILNPVSRAGRALGAFRKSEAELRARLGDFDVYSTRAPLDAADQVRKILKARSYEQILVAGGDGTINEAVNGYFEKGRPLSRSIGLGVINLGTGGDFYKTLRQLNSRYDDDLIRARITMADCGKLTVNGQTRFFVNIASAGVAGSIMHSLKHSAFRGGATAYFFHTIKSLALYHVPSVSLMWEDKDGKSHSIESSMMNLFVCNGRYNGAGMNWAPQASLNDGIFEIVLIQNRSKLDLVLQSRKVYAGRTAEIRGIEVFQSRRLVLRSDETISGELDGEIYGPAAPQSDIICEMVPQSIPILV